MKASFCAVIWLALAGFSMPLKAQLPAEAVLPKERFEVGWPDEKWIKAKDKSDGMVRIIEYIRKGDKLKQWKEIITDQAVVAKFTNAKQAVDTHFQGLSRRMDTLETSIISESPREVVYEWWHSDNRGYGPEHVIGIVIWRPYSVTFFTYARKGSKLPEEQRAMWIKRISEAKCR